MKMIVKSTITSVFDVDSNTTSHTLEIEDEDGLAEVHRDMLGAVVLGGFEGQREGGDRDLPPSRCPALRTVRRERGGLMPQPYDARRKQIDKAPRIRSEANSTGGQIAGLTLGVCLAVLMVMGVVKIGFIWFG